MTDTPFTIEGPDDEGNVWLRFAGSVPPELKLYLGPKDQVAETLSQWLGSIDYDTDFGRDPALVNHARSGHGPTGFDPA